LVDKPIQARFSGHDVERESDIESARSAGIKGFLFYGGSLALFLDVCVGTLRTAAAAGG